MNIYTIRPQTWKTNIHSILTQYTEIKNLSEFMISWGDQNPPFHHVFKNSVLTSFQTLYARVHNFVIPNLSTLNSRTQHTKFGPKKKAPNEKMFKHYDTEKIQNTSYIHTLNLNLMNFLQEDYKLCTPRFKTLQSKNFRILHQIILCQHVTNFVLYILKNFLKIFEIRYKKVSNDIFKNF